MKPKHFKIAAVLFAVGMLWFLGCEKSSTGPGNTLPEVRAIKAENKNLYIGELTQVTCTAVAPAGGTLSYQWSATAGTFAQAEAAETNWTAPQQEGTYVLKCAASDANGERWATVTVFVSLPPPLAARWSFDTDFNDVKGTNHGTAGAGVTIVTDDVKVGTGAAKFEGTDGDVTSKVTAGTALGLGPDDSFTFMMWIKTADVFGFLFGKTFDGSFGFIDPENEGDLPKGAKGLYIGEDGNLLWRTRKLGTIECETAVNDDVWHHVAVVKNGMKVSVYLDGNLDGEMDYEEWSLDGDGVTTLGAASIGGGEEPGSYTGLLDDVRYYSRAMIPDEIIRVINAQ